MKPAVIQSSLYAAIGSVVWAVASPAAAQPAPPAEPEPTPPPALDPAGSADASSASPAPAPSPPPYTEPAAAPPQEQPQPPVQPVQPAPVAAAEPAAVPAQPPPPAPVQAPPVMGPPPAAAPSPGVVDQPVPPAKDTPIHERTGFYFQAALGAGFLSVKDEYDGPYTGTETVKGTGTLASLRFGGGVGAGFVLGAGLESLSGTFDYEDNYRRSETDGTIEAEVEGSGGAAFFLAQKYLGPVFLRVEVGGMWGGAEDEDVEYGGFMLAGGLGADFLVSKSWSLGGVLGVRRTSDTYDDEDGYSGTSTMTVSSIQFSATYY